MKNIIKSNLAVLILLALNASGQVDEIVHRTFYDTRIINGHSVETNPEGVLKFIIQHRFGSVSEGIPSFFGLDDANMRLGIDYGIKNRFTIGIGRSSLERTYDAYFKTKLFRQKKGEKSFPFTITLYAQSAFKALRSGVPDIDDDILNKVTYTTQLLIARKFGHAFSLQMMSTYIHRNLVKTRAESNGVAAIGIAPRLQLTKTLTLNVEYYYVPEGQMDEVFTNSLAIGIDIETKGHVFQLSFGNSRGLIEKMFVTETTGLWEEGDIHFGFNITRDFKIKGRKYRKPKE